MPEVTRLLDAAAAGDRRAAAHATGLIHRDVKPANVLIEAGPHPHVKLTDFGLARPDAILNTINGDSNVAFFRALRAARVTPDDTPTISFSISEEELGSLSTKDLVGDYAAWNYFQTIDRPQNHAFVKRFRAKYGRQRVISDPMEAAYFGVHLWARAVEEARSDNPAEIRKAVRRQSFDAPEGLVRIDPETQHTAKSVRIGQVTPEGRFAVVYDFDQPVAPEPFPATRTRAAWEAFLQDLHMGWGGRWDNPGKPRPD